MKLVRATKLMYNKYCRFSRGQRTTCLTARLTRAAASDKGYNPERADTKGLEGEIPTGGSWNRLPYKIGNTYRSCEVEWSSS